MIAYLTVHRAVQNRGKNRVYPEETAIEKERESTTKLHIGTHMISTPGGIRGHLAFIISLPFLGKRD